MREIGTLICWATDINQIYAFIYEVVEKCEIQNVDFASEIKLI